MVRASGLLRLAGLNHALVLILISPLTLPATALIHGSAVMTIWDFMTLAGTLPCW